MEIFKKLTVILITLILLNLLIFKLVKADDCPSDLSERVICLEKKISATKNQEKTLSSEINLLDEKISLTRSQINLTEQQLGRLTDDISSVSGKISFIEDSLTATSNILANRIAKTYIAGRTDPMVYLLAAADFSDFWQRLEYLRLVQKHDRQLLLQMAATRKNYRDQKDLLEDKKKQIEKLSAQLKSYKVTLDKQNREKQQLLAVTQGDEVRYQGLLSEAKAQLAAFQGFVFSQGGAGLLSNQTKCDDWGCYYNQRDSSWGTRALNNTGYTLADSGCLVTSMAMVITHLGNKSVTPVTINNDPSNFASYFPAYLNKTISAGGSSWTRTGISLSQIDGELSAGKPVVIGIGYGPAHFVVLVSGSNGNYLMNDPFVENGNKIPFTSKYSLANITEIDAVRAN
ncbi:C39 family peptidase [Candidatus Gottesmanbacteria bacterium]|nr:C39 family peptidase [Candidatus Gottesmanbacteria bacterium]